MTTPLLSIQKLEAAYGQIVALKGIDLDVMPGEIVTVIGANGAGKSTTMMSVFGRPPARSGKIFFDGQDITNKPAHEIARLGLAQ
jgi:branched-chain amino acid transport system ATP-binding protein